MLIFPRAGLLGDAGKEADVVLKPVRFPGEERAGLCVKITRRYNVSEDLRFIPLTFFLEVSGLCSLS